MMMMMMMMMMMTMMVVVVVVVVVMVMVMIMITIINWEHSSRNWQNFLPLLLLSYIFLIHYFSISFSL